MILWWRGMFRLSIMTPSGARLVLPAGRFAMKACRARPSSAARRTAATPPGGAEPQRLRERLDLDPPKDRAPGEVISATSCTSASWRITSTIAPAVCHRWLLRTCDSSRAYHGAVRQDLAWPGRSGGLCDAALNKNPERPFGNAPEVDSDVSPLRATIDPIAEQMGKFMLFLRECHGRDIRPSGRPVLRPHRPGRVQPGHSAADPRPVQDLARCRAQ